MTFSRYGNSRLSIMAALMLGILTAAPAHADDYVVREYSFDLGEVEKLELRGSVGSMRIRPVDGTELQVVLEIEGNSEGWFRRHRDVDDVELEVRKRGDRLILEQTEEDTNTTWTIYLPAVTETEIDLGVGEIDAEVGATGISIDLGVGDIDVEAPEATAGRIDLSAGVGDASLHGGRVLDVDRAFVSLDLRGQGSGNLYIDIHVGVGDIDLRLR